MDCLRCGYWMDPPAAVVPSGPATAETVCSACQNWQSFVYLPLFFVTGANGAGKSTLSAPLRKRLPHCVVFDGDVVPLEWTLDEWAEKRTAYRRTCLGIALEIAQSGRPVVFVGTAMPEELEGCSIRPYFAAVHYLALVCDGAVIAQRLRARPSSRTRLAEDFERYLEAQLSVDREYRAQAGRDPRIVLVDSSAESLEELADHVAQWVRARL